MDKYGNQVTNWKHRWFCLTSKQLRYYTNSNETDKKGAVDVSDMIDAQVCCSSIYFGFDSCSF